ncbi:MAG TPA: DUF423 domain-containing protein [Candidatus Binatia bacterium]|nr:DUF423 domain-containing protein [Candidatus Binatia bacterium]
MNWIPIGSLAALVGVLAGAFGAHGLKSHVGAERMEIFEVAVRYQMYHAIGLIIAGILDARQAGWCFFGGILLFSGSLYLVVWTDQRWLGAVTPLGGVFFLLGWLLLAIRSRK